jgi:probable F420-dependent oxidoreductase
MDSDATKAALDRLGPVGVWLGVLRLVPIGQERAAARRIEVNRSGHVYEKRLAHMTAYLDGMDAAAAGGLATEVPVPRVLAALRPRMLELVRDRADGAHRYFVPPSHTLLARQILGPGKLLIPEQAVVLSSDPDDARRTARRHIHGYPQLPNYVRNFKHLGYTDADVSADGSDCLVDAIVTTDPAGATSIQSPPSCATGASSRFCYPSCAMTTWRRSA